MTARWKQFGSLFLAGLLAVPMLAAPRVPAAGTRGPAQPGTINFVEGQASLDQQPLSQSSVGTVLRADQTLTTTNDRVEILLTPGIFLRLDHGASVRMNALGLATKVVGVVSSHAPAYALSFAAGEVREHETRTAAAPQRNGICLPAFACTPSARRGSWKRCW